MMKLALSLLVAAVLALSGEAHAQSSNPTTINVAVVAIDLYAEAYYAQELGLFKKANLDVNLMTLPNSGLVSPAVVGGSANVGVGNTVQIANASTKGIPLTIIAAGGMYSTNSAATALCVAKTSPFQSAQDLAGKIIAVSTLNDQAQVGIESWLEQNGVNPSSVRFVEVRTPEMGDALAQGRVAAAMIPEPSLTIAEQSGARLFAKPFDAIGSQFLIGVWYSTKDWVRSHPDAAARFARAIYQAGRWANTHHDQTAAILAKYSKTDLETLRKMTRSPYAETLSQTMIQLPLDSAYRYHLLTKPVEANAILAALK